MIIVVSRNTTSDRFKRAIATKQYTMADLARVWSGDTVVGELPITGGSVEMDATADVRSRIDTLTVQAEGLVPSLPGDLLAPYGNQLQVCRGVKYPDGDQELVSLGFFRLDETDTEDTGETLSITLSAQDRAAIVSDAKFEDDYQVDNGTLFTDAILDLVRYAIPDVQYNFAATSATTPLVVASQGDDRWTFALGLAEAIGAELFFDGDGILVLRPVPTPGGTPSKFFAEGEDGVLVQASKLWSRLDARNKWLVSGENSDNITDLPAGFAVDDDPTSPTYYYGPFGKVPEFFSSEFVTTDTQAQDMAEGLKARNIGTTCIVSFGVFVDPTLAVSDIVRVTRARLGLDEDHVIDSLSVPLGIDTPTSTGQTRMVMVQ